MKVEIELENNFYGNKEGREELERVFNDLVKRLGSYWDKPLYGCELWQETTLVIYNKDGKPIGKFLAETL